MSRPPRKISLARCAMQGDVALTIWCVTPNPNTPGYGGGPKVCGHRKEMPMAEALALFGADTRLNELRVRCTVCGGKDYDARGEQARQAGRWMG